MEGSADGPPPWNWEAGQLKEVNRKRGTVKMCFEKGFTRIVKLKKVNSLRGGEGAANGMQKTVVFCFFFGNDE